MKIIDFIKDIGQNLLINQNEPYVEQKQDSFGNNYWLVRDRKTNKSYSFGSENKMS